MDPMPSGKSLDDSRGAAEPRRIGGGCLLGVSKRNARRFAGWPNRATQLTLFSESIKRPHVKEVNGTSSWIAGKLHPSAQNLPFLRLFTMSNSAPKKPPLGDAQYRNKIRT